MPNRTGTGDSPSVDFGGNHRCSEQQQSRAGEGNCPPSPRSARSERHRFGQLAACIGVQPRGRSALQCIPAVKSVRSFGVQADKDHGQQVGQHLDEPFERAGRLPQLDSRGRAPRRRKRRRREAGKASPQTQKRREDWRQGERQLSLSGEADSKSVERFPFAVRTLARLHPAFFSKRICSLAGLIPGCRFLLSELSAMPAEECPEPLCSTTIADPWSPRDPFCD